MGCAWASSLLSAGQKSLDTSGLELGHLRMPYMPPALPFPSHIFLVAKKVLRQLKKTSRWLLISEEGAKLPGRGVGGRESLSKPLFSLL